MPYREPEFLPWDGRRVPITFVGGYLGAGKTTAINELLAHTDRPVAVIVNDVGSVNIDAALIRKRHGDTIELTNGCICCSSLDDMGQAMDMIRSRPQPPDHVVVELSGVADPDQMLPWGRSAGFVLDGLVVVVAADQLIGDTVPAWLQHHLDAQLAAADLLVLTKTDLVSAEQTRSARLRLADLAPTTPVLDGGRAPLLPGAVGRFLSLGARHPDGPATAPSSTLFDAHDVRSMPAPVGADSKQLTEWLQELPRLTGLTIVRVKGMVMTTDLGLVLVQMVGTRCEITAVPLPERQAPTDLVVISLKE